MESLALISSLVSTLASPVTPSPHDGSDNWYQPATNSHWQIQLQGAPNTGYPVDVFILDLFDTSSTIIQDIHASGRHVICYFSAGSYEDWREDKHRFLPSDKGRNLDGWPGERWIDIRSQNVRAIMSDRIALAAEKGCDGIDPDNVDGYTNNTGFALSGRDQLDYHRFLAALAHEHGLAISLKNNLAQTHELVSITDFAINESCHQWQECDQLAPFIDAGKAVFHIDYVYANDSDARSLFCQSMREQSFRSLTLPVALDDSYRFSCDE